MRKVISLLALTFGMWTMVFLCFNGCTKEETTSVENAQVQEKGKGKKAATTVLAANVVNENEFGRVMLPPVEYSGELPTYNGLIDWDLDGEIDDIVELQKDCYFPKTKTQVNVYLNGTDLVVVSYAVNYTGNIIGFADVDNDGDTDIVFSRGKYVDYNNGESSPIYTVGYNEAGQYPLSPSELLQGLEVAVSTNNPDRLVWSLDGLEFYGLHIRFREVGSNVWNQITTYGEWGFAVAYFTPNSTIEMEFSNMGENCGEYIYVTFQI